MTNENTQAPDYAAQLRLMVSVFSMDPRNSSFLLEVADYIDLTNRLHQAELAAVIEKAVDRLHAEAPHYDPLDGPEHDQGYASGWQSAVDHLRDLTPPDAAAALQAERDKAWKDAIEAVCDYMGDPDSDGDSYYIKKIRALKRN